MEAQRVVLPSGKSATLVASQTLTPVANQQPKVIEVPNCRAVAFFIGGAGDKEAYYFAGPYRNIFYAQEPFDKRIQEASKGIAYTSHHISYKDARGESDIQNAIVAKIPDKATPIYIVGHSLGGWNGAHLSSILTVQGYHVEMLVTLDPVGDGAFVWLGSDIYYKKPEPKCRLWINVRATPSEPDASDSVAGLGKQWSISSGPDINYSMDINHANAWSMFLNPIQGGKSAADYMYESVVSCVGR